MKSDGNMVLNSIRHETKVFLTKYMQIDYENIEAVQDNSNKLTLNDFSTVIYVRGNLDFALMMSYEESILKRISNTFLDGAKVEEDEKEEIYDSVAKETANIIVGLSFTPSVDDGSVSKITPPFDVDDILIKKFENIKTFSEDLITEFGKMSINIIDYAKKEI